MLMLLGVFGGNEGDEALLSLLAVKGSDLSKPHEIDFFLYFPFGGYTWLAAKLIAQAGFRTKVTKFDNAGWHKWDLQATKTIIPRSWTLRRLRIVFSVVALLGLGKYDGWQTGLVK
ncbi:MAG TPA: ribonuclease E inhibitor RraB [Candidatus Angelobacter sp.]|nr:ribonuclease E inhibitor RraB [Candidatus Angelobacter sp.]